VSEEESPNKTLDASIKKLLKDSETAGFDELILERRRKAILAAITWERAKHAILNKGEGGFDPDEL
jgi:hypothetical protein